MYTNKLRILYLEDTEADVEYISRILLKSDIPFDLQVVSSKGEYIEALRDFVPDLILSDHNLPDINSIEALDILKRKDIRIPFILVTSTVSEEFAAQIILTGANDYILKDRPERLPIAINNVLEKFRIEKEEQLSINKQVLAASIVNFSSEAIISKTIEGIVTSWNPSAQRIFGYSEQEAIGRDISFIVPEDIADDEQVVIRKVNSGIPVINYETIRMTKSGKYCSVLLTASPIKDSTGNITDIATILTDVTELKETHDANIKSSYRLQAILNQSMDVICTLSAEGKFVTMSAACEKIWGYTPDEMIDRSHIDFVCEDYKDGTLDIAADIMSGIEQTNFENYYKHKNGQHVPVIWSSRWDNKSNLMYAVARDGRERKESDLERTKMLNDILQRNIDLEQFSYIVSHNLRAPVANIIGISDIIYNTNITKEDEKKLMTGLSLSVKRLDDVVMDLNHILQIRQGGNYQKETVKLISLVSDIKLSISNLIKTENVVINIDFSQIEELNTVKSYIYSIFTI